MIAAGMESKRLGLSQKNLYVVIVVDVINKTILGHYILDLNEKYGLNN